MRKLSTMLLGVFLAALATSGAWAQGMPPMQGRQPCAPSSMPMQQQPMQRMQPCAGQTMGGMKGERVPNPTLLISSFEKQVVLPDEALPFEPTGMGEKFSAKLIALVDFGNDVWFPIRKARIPKGGMWAS